MIDFNAMDSEKIELMDEYFDSRVDVYDIIHQQTGISWGKQIRDIISEYIPKEKCKILDLGCGTGLELEEILKKSPNSEIVCVDVSKQMLNRLIEKYKNYNITIVNEDFFELNLEKEQFDFVISVMALHHFLKEDKIKLYKNISQWLKKDGLFINSDFIIDDKEYSDKKIKEYKEIKKENPNKLFHFDIPFTENMERFVLSESGFLDVKKVYENKKTKVLLCKKGNKK